MVLVLDLSLMVQHRVFNLYFFSLARHLFKARGRTGGA